MPGSLLPWLLSERLEAERTKLVERGVNEEAAASELRKKKGAFAAVQLREFFSPQPFCTSRLSDGRDDDCVRSFASQRPKRNFPPNR